MTACAPTGTGGWHCSGTGCLDAGRVCLLTAADPYATAPAWPTVSREAMGLEPSAGDLLREHYRLMVDAMDAEERRFIERAFLPTSETGAQGG